LRQYARAPLDFNVRPHRKNIVSFDLFIRFYDHGAPAGIALEDVRAAFAPYISSSDATHLALEYDVANGSYVHLKPHPNNADATVAIAVNRPCGDMRLWDSLARVLRLGNAVLFFPGGANPMVGSTDAVPHLPRDMIETLGNPVVVASGKAILALVHAV
jgi:hypothetical protein